MGTSDLQKVFETQTGINMLKCSYCDKEAELVNSTEIYGQGRDYGWFWLCKLCGAFVGCHKGTKKPMGTLANKEIRELRKQAHALFDPIWRSRQMTRKQAYRRMAEILAVDSDEAHISMLSKDNLEKLIRSLKKRLQRV